MNSNKETQRSVALAVILLIVGVLCYAAFPAKSSDKPVRLMFQCTAGKVLFDHKIHTDDSGYGISCTDCHHHPEDEDSAAVSCGGCHPKSDKDNAAVLQSCGECHEPDEIEDTELVKRSDAFHSQCIDCHKESEAGPQAKECALCHVM